MKAAIRRATISSDEELVKKRLIHRKIYFGFMAIALCLVSACYEQQEGCLDALASNFEIDSDEGCPSCCEYPQLTFTIKHLYDTLNFDLGKVYSNQLGQTFIPQAISFYVSDVTLLQGENWLPIDQSILISDGQANVEQPDDVTILTRNGFDFSIGRFLNSGRYTGLRFSLGLNEPEFSGGQQTVFETTNHPLDTLDNDLWSDVETYRMYSVELLLDTAAMDTISYVAVASPSISFDLPIDIVKLRGQKLSIPLAIDYQKWFNEIDFDSDPTDEIRRKIADGIQNSISVIE